MSIAEFSAICAVSSSGGCNNPDASEETDAVNKAKRSGTLE
jgi:hypothetical protein